MVQNTTCGKMKIRNNYFHFSQVLSYTNSCISLFLEPFKYADLKEYCYESHSHKPIGSILMTAGTDHLFISILSYTLIHFPLFQKTRIYFNSMVFPTRISVLIYCYNTSIILNPCFQKEKIPVSHKTSLQS